MSLLHQRSPYRFFVDRFVAAHLPCGWGLKGLDLGGPSPQPRPRAQEWESANPDPAMHATYVAFAEDLGTFPDAEFDMVQCADCLYLVANVPKALREIHRVLKPGGTLVATVPCVWPPAGPADWGRWPKARWEAVLSVAGFEEIAVTPFGGPWTMVEQVLHDWLDWWPPMLCRLDRKMTWPVVFGITARR